MASAGIGVDIVEISRMESILQKTPSFARRFFTEEERAYSEATARPAAHYACRFAAREAVLKALGTGFSSGVGRLDVSVSRDAQGKPLAVLSGRAQEIAHELGILEVALSLSFTGDYAIANALAITEAVRPVIQEEPEDDRARLARSFREARSVLDDLERVFDNPAQDELSISEHSDAVSHT
ncbi:holo-ACP synthase [Collinsella sp. AGMB00827]|uniref:Holo-[acyl-carrier-protein] synthase n=1 Tax=Collinsella ureilytica TaxID=2869515 RepID=A0ABS7MIR9_9ACTN|nr:holo-ACP synthase [Collinsella urealyticum]MBY4797261.1 holo-ACP synthase [Collinsella urealyticum]